MQVRFSCHRLVPLQPPDPDLELAGDQPKSSVDLFVFHALEFGLLECLRGDLACLDVKPLVCDPIFALRFISGLPEHDHSAVSLDQGIEGIRVRFFIRMM